MNVVGLHPATMEVLQVCNFCQPSKTYRPINTLLWNFLNFVTVFMKTFCCTCKLSGRNILLSLSISGQCENFFGSFKCLCPAGWTGQTCGQLVDHCSNTTCANGGECISIVLGYVCDCSNTGFQGTHCDININDCIGKVK